MQKSVEFLESPLEPGSRSETVRGFFFGLKSSSSQQKQSLYSRAQMTVFNCTDCGVLACHEGNNRAAGGLMEKVKDDFFVVVVQT